MTREELARRLERVRCRVVGWRDAPTDGNRRVVAAVAEAFDNSESAVLVEPSLSRKTSRPPDVVLIDPEVGVAVFEVKGVGVEQVEEIEAGGVLAIRYRGRLTKRNAVAQVRTQMFDIKDATGRVYEGELTIPFRYFVAFPAIHRAEWVARFGKEGFCPPEFLFTEDLERAALLGALRATDRERDLSRPIRTCRLEELQCVWKAFGDNSVLYVRAEQRPERKVEEGTLGEFFDQRASALKTLSAEQKELGETFWEKGPRLVRGVAGSGKTIVLAVNLARRAKRMLVEGSAGLFDAAPRRPRIAAVCFNRTLAPFLETKIKTAFEQRTGKALPDGVVHVRPMNGLMYALSREGAWPYESMKGVEPGARASRYREHLARLKERDAEKFGRIAFDAIYVDEGQDFVEEEFRLLRDLCRTGEGDEPSLFVFYDDAQNLYGRSRPNWGSLGLNVRGGRAFVMTQCFRNPRAVVETSFNVLYGTALDGGKSAPSREYADIGWLQEKGLIAMDGGRWRVRFAPRKGRPPILTLASDAEREIKLILARLIVLVRDERVRPQDILILSFRKERARAIADAIRRERIAGIKGVHVAFDDKESALCQPGRVTVSTVHSAKGYDAFVVLLCSANEFKTDVKGRACFYVACTRAVEHLEVFGYERSGLVVEMGRLLEGAR